MNTEIHLYGSLSKKVGKVNPLIVDLPAPVDLSELSSRVGIPIDLIQMMMINHTAVAQDSRIEPGDRVALFPREYPLFADWRSFRIRR